MESSNERPKAINIKNFIPGFSFLLVNVNVNVN